MRGPDKFTAYLLDLLAPIGPVSARPMFGGVGLFHSGMMFGLIARDELFLKVGDTNRAAYEAAGEAPFSYETKHGTHTIGSYWRCPPDSAGRCGDVPGLGAAGGGGRCCRGPWQTKAGAQAEPTLRQTTQAVTVWSIRRRSDYFHWPDRHRRPERRQAARVNRFTNAEIRCRRISLRALSSVVM